MTNLDLAIQTLLKRAELILANSFDRPYSHMLIALVT